MKGERYSTVEEIKNRVRCANGQKKYGGVVVYAEDEKIYVDNSEAHVKIVGNTGMGKSSCVVNTSINTCLDAGESVIVIDPKGYAYESTKSKLDNHRPIIFDFRNPANSPDGINVWSLAAKMLKSENIADRDTARSFIRNIASGACIKNEKDEFWTYSAERLLTGMLYGLIEVTDYEAINMKSLVNMLENSEKKFAASTYLNEFANMLPKDSFAKSDLEVYLSNPPDTKGNIRSFAQIALSPFKNSEGLMRMMCNDTVDLEHFDTSKPFAMYIILPDEDDANNPVAGIIVSYFTQFLIKKAQNDYEGMLPVRVNIFLEELSSVGKAITHLPQYLNTSRSRNIRIFLCIQSDAQLASVYGKDGADNINSCIGVTVAFSTNDRNMLEEWSKELGNKKVIRDGQTYYEPLCSANQIKAMAGSPVGRVLVFIQGGIKYFTHLPFCDDIYPRKETGRKYVRKEVFGDCVYLDVPEFVKSRKREQMLKFTGKRPSGFTPFFGRENVTFSEMLSDIDKAIDERIAELDMENERQKKLLDEMTKDEEEK